MSPLDTTTENGPLCGSISKEQARDLAIEQLHNLPIDLPPGDSLIILDDKTIDKPWGWLFFYTSQLFHETGDLRYTILGNAPVIVNRFDSSVYFTESVYSYDREVRAYEAQRQYTSD